VSPPDRSRSSDEHARRAVVARLSREFRSVRPAVIEQKVSEGYTHRADVRIDKYLPVLVERAVRDELRDIVRTGTDR